MKILFLVPYPLSEAPSQRFRFEQYFNILTKNGFSFRSQSFLTSKNWQLFYSKGNTVSKVLAIISGIVRRFLILFRVPVYNYVFIHRELCPLGPPIFEWIIAKVLQKKIMYDFDDAIWLTDKINEGPIEKIVRWRIKVRLICKWSYKVSCGNEYLCAYARQFNNHVVLNPTTIDTELLHNPKHYLKNESLNITIGWTGSHSTQKYLMDIESTLQQIEQQFSNVWFVVIANQKPELLLTRLRFVPWQKKTEALDLMKIDIGIMPLPDDEWTKGKCGFKALQYMAMEIPAVVSPVGVNVNIVTHGMDGFLANTQEDWFNFLVQLINDKQLRLKMGQLGREKIIQHYSISSNSATFLSLFEK